MKIQLGLVVWKAFCLAGWLVVFPVVTLFLLLSLSNARDRMVQAEKRAQDAQFELNKTIATAEEEIKDLQGQIQSLSDRQMQNLYRGPVAPGSTFSEQSSRPSIPGELTGADTVPQDSSADEQARDLLQDALKEKEEILASARDEANRILSRSKSLAAKEANRIIEEAKAKTQFVNHVESDAMTEPAPSVPSSIAIQITPHSSIQVKIHQVSPAKSVKLGDYVEVQGTIENMTNLSLDKVAVQIDLLGTKGQKTGDSRQQVENMGPRGKAPFKIDIPVDAPVAKLKVSRIVVF